MQIDTFKEILGDVDRFNTGGGDEIFTPPNIVQDMLDLLPESVWSSKTRFLDICCKSGNFLIEIYNRLDRILSSDNNFKDPVKRRKHILENQIYGICTDSFEEMMIKRRMLGDPFSDNENISTIAYVHPVSGSSKQFKELAQLSKQKTLKKREEQLGYLKDAIKEKFKQMDFDVVVGNPPYNNDMYLDFVMIGHELAKQFTLMITPAKWQAKGGGQNDLFRKIIVPYMSKIVYYPDATDVFDITSCGGITYFCMQRDNKNDEHYLEIKVKKKKSFYSNEQIRLDTTNQRYTYYDSKINRLAEHFKSKSKLSSIIFDEKDKSGEYRVISSHLLDDKRYQNCMGGYILTPLSICKRTDAIKQNMYELFNGQFEQCNQFKSYVNTKTVRFLVALGICASSVRNPETWRFVPDPGAFDHIFTDEELYKKYNLTDDEIKLIESVIKERK